MRYFLLLSSNSSSEMSTLNLALVGTTGKIALGKITLGTTDTHTVTFLVKFFKNTGTATSPVKGDQVGENLSINITQNA
jgi:hypothetical protein